MAHSIDPNENVFVQRVMCNENYVVFNGIDQTPAYNLQMMIYVLFVCKNNLPENFLRKCGKVTQLILHISDYVATSSLTEEKMYIHGDLIENIHLIGDLLCKEETKLYGVI